MVIEEANKVSTIDALIGSLTSFRSENVFNPWAQNCSTSDNDKSCTVRTRNLRIVLSACLRAQEVDIWIGRDLGWRGGRRTGVPFIDELTIEEYGRSIFVNGLSKATVDAPMRERTATEIHVARRRIPRTVFFWNVFPYHPFEQGNHQSNRMHTAQERDIGCSIMMSIIELFNSCEIVTIGNDATNAVKRIGRRSIHVRHPSYGGQADFHRQINAHYGLKQAVVEQSDLFL